MAFRMAFRLIQRNDVVKTLMRRFGLSFFLFFQGIGLVFGIVSTASTPSVSQNKNMSSMPLVFYPSPLVPFSLNNSTFPSPLTPFSSPTHLLF